MPKCPKCGEEIEELRNYCEKTATFYVCLKNGNLDYALDSEGDDYTEGGFECPKCAEELFTSEDDAKAFLAGK